LLRSDHSDAQIASGLRHLWTQRQDRYSQQRRPGGPRTAPVQRIEMSYIGG